VDKADIVSIDRLGMYVKMTNQFGSSKVRVPFVRPVADRKDLKQIFVDMTNESAGARA
jgi:putative heme iron utilization protein